MMLLMLHSLPARVDKWRYYVPPAPPPVWYFLLFPTQELTTAAPAETRQKTYRYFYIYGVEWGDDDGRRNQK